MKKDWTDVGRAIAFIEHNIEVQKAMLMYGDGLRNAKIKNFENVRDCLKQYKERLFDEQMDRVNGEA